jgi:hypothetical protein
LYHNFQTRIGKQIADLTRGDNATYNMPARYRLATHMWGSTTYSWASNTYDPKGGTTSKLYLGFRVRIDSWSRVY